MRINLQDITVRELTQGYVDKADAGVVGYEGRLNIRPAFQREFIYSGKQRDEVIHTVRKDFPLNTMYWALAVVLIYMPYQNRMNKKCQNSKVQTSETQKK